MPAARDLLLEIDVERGALGSQLIEDAAVHAVDIDLGPELGGRGHAAAPPAHQVRPGHVRVGSVEEAFAAAVGVPLKEPCVARRAPRLETEPALPVLHTIVAAHTGREDLPYPPALRLPALLAAALSVDTAAVAAACAARGQAGPVIGQAVMAARTAAVQAALIAPGAL